jgi:cytochrome c biogenesis protein CcmG, thiol:disulfide interchange protein DsbE
VPRPTMPGTTLLRCMRRLILPGLVVVAAAALLALLAFGVSNQGANTSIDSAVQRGAYPPAPSAGMALPVLGSSRTERLADFRGKVVVLNVFASWCTPCAAESPILEREQRALALAHATILGVTYLDTSGDAAQFVHQHHLTYPVLRDVNGNFVRSFGTTGVPETFVIDRRGRIVALRRYVVDSKWLVHTLARFLPRRV